MTGTLGRSESGRKIEQAAIDTAVKWGTTYIADAERNHGIPPMSVPVPGKGSFTTVGSVFEKWTEQAMPAVMVIAPGLGGDPRREADRTYTAPINIGIGILASSTFEGAGREIAQLIGAAFREMFLEVPLVGLEGRIDEIEYRDERYNDIPSRGEYNLGSARLVYTVWIKKWAGGGRPRNLTTPPADPYAVPQGWSTVESVHSQINVEDPS